jgi:hypothetical protein
MPVWDKPRGEKEDGMKKFMVIASAAAIVIIMAGAAFAAASPTVGVTANVQNKCVVDANGSFLTFNIDPDSGVINKTTALNGTPPSVKCTKGTAVAITCSPALNATGVLTDGDATSDIVYTVTGCPSIASAGGFGSADTIDIGIQIAAGAAANSKAGDHTGTITVTTQY